LSPGRQAGRQAYKADRFFIYGIVRGSIGVGPKILIELGISVPAD
jgi:hypothetical protein